MRVGLLIFLLFVGAATPAAAVDRIAARGGVVGSVHDMNTVIGAKPDPEARVCPYCHTPHHAAVDARDPEFGSYLPLWSRTLPAQGYPQYAEDVKAPPSPPQRSPSTPSSGRPGSA